MTTDNFRAAWNWTIQNGGWVYSLPQGGFLATLDVRFDLLIATPEIWPY